MVVGWPDAHRALDGADIALLLCPVNMHREILELLVPHIPDHPIAVGTAYAQGGFDWQFREVLKKYPTKAPQTVVFGMKHFPFLCKAVEYGKQVKCFGRYPLHKVALAPETPENRKRVGGMLSSIFTDIPMEKCSWPTVCVAATNQILHPCILAQIFNGYSPENEKTFKEHMLFYLSVDAVGGENMAQLYFNDFPEIGNALNKLFKDYPKELLKGVDFYEEQKYEVATSVVLTLPKWFRSMAWFLVSHFTGEAIKSNQRLKYVKAPMKEVKGKDGSTEYMPITDSRMFYDDIPHGLCVLFGIAEILHVPTPMISKMIIENQIMMGKEYLVQTPDAKGRHAKGRDWGETAAPQNFGVRTREELAEFMVWDRLQEHAEQEEGRNVRLQAKL